MVGSISGTPGNSYTCSKIHLLLISSSHYPRCPLAISTVPASSIMYTRESHELPGHMHESAASEACWKSTPEMRTMPWHSSQCRSGTALLWSRTPSHMAPQHQFAPKQPGLSRHIHSLVAIQGYFLSLAAQSQVQLHLRAMNRRYFTWLATVNSLR